MEDGHDARMESAPLPRLLAGFALPALGGMLANALYNIVDRIFVGQTIGRSGLAAIALAFPCMLISFSLSLMLGAGAASRVSIKLGERKTDDAERALGASFAMACAGGVVLASAALIYCREILAISGASEQMMGTAEAYLRIVLVGVPFQFVGSVLANEIRAAGSPSYAMGSQIVGALINIGLDAWFVLGLGMGVEGAAAATAVSQLLSFGWTVAWFFSRRAAIRLRARHIFRVDLASASRIISVGMPSCFVELNFALVNMFITNTVSFYGGDVAVSATGVYTSLDSLLFLPGLAIGEACQPIIGYNYGARRPERVLGTVRLGIIAATLFYLSSWAVIMLAAEWPIMLFVHADAELVEVSARAMRVSNIGIPLFGIITVSSSFMQGLGRGRDAMISSGIRYAVFLWIPLLIMPRLIGLYGAWGAFSVSDICGAIVAGWFIKRTAAKLRDEME